jgi:hypothetical protein
MKSNEIDLVIGFLEDLSYRFSNDGCNEIFLENTPENRELVLQAQLAVNSPRNEIKLYEIHAGQPKKICTNNILIIDYLISKLNEKDHTVDPEKS